MFQKPSSPIEPHLFDDFTLKAEVDRVLIRISLQKPTQSHALRRHLPPSWGNTYVVAVDGAPSRTDTKFDLWVQDPAGPDTLQRDIDSLAHRFPMAVPVEVIAVEVALDFYRKPEAGTTLEDLCFMLVRRHARPPGDKLITRRENRFDGPPESRFASAADPRELREAMRNGWTVQASDDTRHDCSRYYVKRNDSINDESYTDLPSQLHRARMERTLRGPLCPFGSLDEWRRFDFSSLTSYFTLREHISAPNGPLANAGDWSSPGGVQDRARGAQHRRMTKSHTRADRRSYDLARAALRRLTTAQGRAWDAPDAGIRQTRHVTSAPSTQEQATGSIFGPKYLQCVPVGHSELETHLLQTSTNPCINSPPAVWEVSETGSFESRRLRGPRQYRVLVRAVPKPVDIEATSLTCFERLPHAGLPYALKS